MLLINWMNLLTIKFILIKIKEIYPAIDGTSSLSPYLSSGVLSSRQCLFKVFEKLSEEEEESRPG